MKRFLSGLPLFALALSSWAQVSSAPPLLNYKGTTLPSTCTVGRLFFDTDATAGSNVYGCTSTNTWTLQGGGGGSSLTATRIGFGSAGNTLTGSTSLTWNDTSKVMLLNGGAAGYLQVIGGSNGGINLDGDAKMSFWSGSSVLSNEYLRMSSGAGAPTALATDSSGQISMSSSATDVTSADTFLTRGGVATWRLGQANAAIPVAHTIVGQSPRAGADSNTAGASVTVAGGPGTGTGVGGSLIFRTAPAGSAGSSLNALVTALTIDSTATATFAGTISGNGAGITGIPPAGVTGTALTLAGGTLAGHLLFTDNTYDIGASGATRPRNLYVAGTITTGSVVYTGGTSYAINGGINGGNGSAFGIYSAGDYRATINGTVFATSVPFGFASSYGVAADIYLTRSAAATLQQGAANAASPVAQTLQAQGSRSGTDTNVAGASYTIRPGAGTGNATPASFVIATYVPVASGTGAQTSTAALTLSNSLTLGSHVVTPASSGTRYLCISTAGVVTSSASACSGT